ncbi:MAG TPA: AprI/Inh family metalloprotease inhibitor [Pseudolabrys sp.]
MLRHVVILGVSAAAAMLSLIAGASAQAAPPDSDAARLVGAPWEMANADRDKVCDVTFRTDRAAQGSKVEFDPKCGNLFPLVKDIVGWKFAENDLLRLVDGSGKTLIEFGEVETGVFEAPTPGVGLLFLQAPGGAVTASRPADDMFGEWVFTRAGNPVCNVTLDGNASNGQYPVKLRPNCDPAIAQQGFTTWTMDQGELLLTPSRGAPWRFEEVDAANFRRIPAGGEIMLSRP